MPQMLNYFPYISEFGFHGPSTIRFKICAL